VLDARSAHSLQDDERFVAMASEVASLRDDNASLRGELEKAQDALANLRVRYHQLLEELHLLKRRLVVAKAERLDDIADAQLAFDKLLAETQAIQKVLDDAAPSDEPAPPASSLPCSSSTRTKAAACSRARKPTRRTIPACGTPWTMASSPKSLSRVTRTRASRRAESRIARSPGSSLQSPAHIAS
jgi:hypothetical protein